MIQAIFSLSIASYIKYYNIIMLLFKFSTRLALRDLTFFLLCPIPFFFLLSCPRRDFSPFFSLLICCRDFRQQTASLPCLCLLILTTTLLSSFSYYFLNFLQGCPDVTLLSSFFVPFLCFSFFSLLTLVIIVNNYFSLLEFDPFLCLFQ